MPRQMGLAALPKLATLKSEERPRVKLPTASKLRVAEPEDKFSPTGLSQSREEEWIKRFLATRQGHWYQQRAFQATRTTADFASDYYRAVIQADGAYFHDPKADKDAILSSVIRARGYRPFRFRYPTFEYVVRNFPTWYLAQGFY